MRDVAKHSSRLHRRWNFDGDFVIYFDVEITGESQGNLLCLSTRSGRTLCMFSEDATDEAHRTVSVVCDVTLVDNPDYVDCDTTPDIPPNLPRNRIFMEWGHPSWMETPGDGGGDNVFEAGTYRAAFSRRGNQVWLEIYTDVAMSDLKCWEYSDFGSPVTYTHINACETYFGDYDGSAPTFTIANLMLNQ